MPNPPHGALLDDRPLALRDLDFNHNEIAGGDRVPQWLSKTQPAEFQYDLSSQIWRRFKVRDQDTSGACVAFTLAKISSILLYNDQKEYVDFSPASIYVNRVNKPGAGMLAYDAWSIVKNLGVSLDVLMPSDNLNEWAINRVPMQVHDKLVAAQFKMRGYVQISGFDAIAGMVERGIPVMAWFSISGKEWGDYPTTMPGITAFSGHSVTVVDAVNLDGINYLVIEDSWGTFDRFPGQRLISKQYFNSRTLYAAYPRTFTFATETSIKPSYDGSFVSLQECLKWAGFFPVDVDSTGVYGPVTRRAVLAFQKANQLEQVGVVGPKTTEALHTQFP